MRPNSLTGQFLLTLLVSTSLFVALGWFAVREMRKGLETQVAETYLPRWADNAAWRVSDRIREIRQACDRLAATVRNAVAAGDLEAFEARISLDTRFLNDVDLVLLVDRDGKVLFHKQGPHLDPQTLASREHRLPRSVDGDRWFVELRRGKGLVWEPWGMSHYLHPEPQSVEPERVSKDPSDYHVGYAVRIGDTQDWAALFVLLRWQEVQAVLDEVRAWLEEDAGLPSAEVFLIDSGATVVAHTDRERYRSEFQSLELVGDMQLSEGAGGSRFIDEAGHPRRAGYAAVREEGPRYWLGLHAREDELFATSGRFSDTLLWATGIALTILILWSLVAFRRIQWQVRALASATEAVARGDLSVRVPARGKHELADLGRAFNAMAEDLSVSRDQLKHAERQAAWAEMARQVAHEIKNPLTPMRMSAQLLLRAQREDGKRVEELTDRLARAVIEQTDALDKIASDFRQFAGSPSRELRPIEADELLRGVEGAVGAMAEGRDVDLGVHPGAGDAIVEVDEHEFQRVFLNLMHNAMAACGSGGSVELSSSFDDGTVSFKIADSGPGVPPELRDRLFEPYFTTKSSGTGLGLAICRRIVEAHGGTIGLESSRPGRTEFVVTLPAVRKDRSGSEGSIRSGPGSMGRSGEVEAE